MTSDVYRSSQTEESTGDGLAFSNFRSSSDYNSSKMTWILDYHSYIVDRINLSTDRV